MHFYGVKSVFEVTTLNMLPFFLLPLLSSFTLEVRAESKMTSKNQNVQSKSPPDVVRIVCNKSLHRTPEIGYVIFNFHPTSKLDAENARQFHAQSYKQCLVTCASSKTCLSINFGKQPIFFHQGKAQYLCELLSTDKYSSSSKYQNPHPDFDHYSIRSNCSTSPCLHNFTCIPDYDNDSYNCSCPRPAFKGKNCQDVDECTTGQHNCNVNADCTNTIGSFICKCKHGYFGNGRNCEMEFDVDECTTGQHNCNVNADCTNTIGSFNCTCKDGYVGNGRNCEMKIALQSDILRDYGNDSYRAALKTFMGIVDIVNTPWTRCWSGMNDGFDVTTTFHPKCDGKGPTVTLVRKGQYIWGGYTNVPWLSPPPPDSTISQASTMSFIFSLYNIHHFNPQKFNIVNTNRAVYHDKDYGPLFGGREHDLTINNLASTSKKNLNIPYAYATPSGCTPNTYCNFFTGISGSGYKIDDIEVFHKV